MVPFKTTIQKFKAQGEKTGWTYIEIPLAVTEKINPGIKKSYRVKGKLDDYAIKGISILPMGNGMFIMALNASMRKAIRKQKGDILTVQLEKDTAGYKQDEDFLQCLSDEPAAKTFFLSLTKGHQNYFSKWIESAKTAATKSKRIAQAINALAKKWGYPEMLRDITATNKLLKK